MPGPRRAVKLPYTEKNIRCPHCKAQLFVGTVMGTILMSRRNCPKCGQQFLIENDLPSPQSVPGWYELSIFRLVYIVV
jgi:transposase-like protein